MSRDLSITSADNGTTNIPPTNGTDPNIAYNAGGTATVGYVTSAQIEALTNPSIRLQVARDLFGSNPVTLSTPGQSLTLQAGRNITIDANGSLQADGTINLDAASSAVPDADPAGVLTIAGSLTSTSGAVTLTAGTGASTISGNVATATGLTIDTSGTATVSGVVSGAGGLTQAGSGTTVLTIANTYTGVTSIRSGTLALGSATSGNTTTYGSVSGSDVDVAAGATFDVSGNGSPFGASVQSLSGSGNVVTTTSSGGTQMSSKGLTLTGSGTHTFAGTISGTGDLTQNGDGTQILTGTNTYTGDTTVSRGRLQLGDGGTSGSIASSASITVNDTGILAVNRSDAFTLSQQISGTGALVQAGTGTTTLSANSTYGGGTTIEAGTLDLAAAGSAGTGAITFSSMSGSASAQLVLEQGAQAVGGTFSNTLNSFGDNEVLVLRGFAYTGPASYAPVNGVLTIQGGTGGAETQSFNLTDGEGTYYAYSDGQGGTIISADAVCYCAGTLIRTAHGDVAVEDLAIGDTVVTASGVHRPIKWIGTRSYAGRFANANPGVLPICFHAGSLADGVPARELRVSPKHAMFLDNCLIPAEHLVNGITIVKAERVEEVIYFHVELDSHDVLLAEGAASESFVDDEGRGIFHNAPSFHALYPDEARTEAVYCAPRVEGGYVLEAVRARLAERAGVALPEARIFGALRGQLDLCDGRTVSGWAQDLLYPDAPVCLDVLVDGAVVALAYADRHRPDLEAAGIGDGCHAFAVTLPAPLTPAEGHTLTLRRSADGRPVGQPLRLGVQATSARVAA